ncbi:uncharacterized protein [Rutidosis leptorrhynchoides]|uniref:uncharacterized protein n=1 Tax=Rutidosis leptorrhynchoides TaxID=125765 RepID=UPI003A99F78B
MAKWAIELGEHDIEFRVRHAIKGQVLADFIAETDSVNEKDTKNSTQIITPKIESEEWKLYTDGASSSDGSGAGLMLVNPKGKEFTYALRFEFATTNKEAEYEALLVGLRMAKELKILHLRAFVDSQIVSNQIKGTFEAKQPTIQHYLSKAKELIKSNKSFNIEHVRRSQNKKADALSKLASLTFEHLAKEVLVEVLEKKSMLEEEVNDLIQEDEVTWMTPLQVYLETGKLPEDKNEARKIRIKAPSYKMMNGVLYRRSFLTPWLRCVGPKQATVIIQEMHEGICGLHAGSRSVVAKIMRLGYYWPTIHHDTTTVLQTCESCQIHSNVPRLPKQELISVTSAWPFVKWGIDIVGPILVRSSSRNILGQWERIRRRNIPKILKAIENPAKLHLGISSPRQWTGGSNKPRHNQRNREALRTTPKGSNGETPYSLTYRTEAILPTEIQVLTERTTKNENNEENLRVNLDLLEERSEAAVIREASYKRTIEGYYNKRVKTSTFKVGEYVLRLNSVSKWNTKENWDQIGKAPM